MSYLSDVTAERREDALNEAEHEIRADYIKCMTESVRKVDPKFLCLDFVSYRNAPGGKEASYPLTEVVVDYLEGEVLDRLMDVLGKSDCPYVQAWREAMAKKFADQHADQLAEFRA